MLKFYTLRSARDIFCHIILILLPILLISFFSYIYSRYNIAAVTPLLTIGFALTFQIYGSALSFETLGQDFLSPMRNRLLATPANPVKIVLSILFSGIIVSFLQTFVVLIFSATILYIKFNNLFLILLVMLISVVFNQLFGCIILFLSKNVKTANSVTTLYGIVAPILAGLYFPLPDNIIINLFEKYLTPMALAQTAILGVMDNNLKNIAIGTIPLIILSLILFLLIKPLSKKVILWLYLNMH